MSFNTQELLNAISIVSDNENLRVCVKQTAKGAAICGAMSIVGGLLFGPRGLALGGAVGGITAYGMSDNFKSLSEILLYELTPKQKNQLAKSVLTSVANVGVTNMAVLTRLLTRDSNIQRTVLRAVKFFMKNQLCLEVIE